jgi:hypothetical protein
MENWHRLIPTVREGLLRDFFVTIMESFPVGCQPSGKFQIFRVGFKPLGEIKSFQSVTNRKEKPRTFPVGCQLSGNTNSAYP